MPNAAVRLKVPSPIALAGCPRGRALRLGWALLLALATGAAWAQGGLAEPIGGEGCPTAYGAASDPTYGIRKAAFDALAAGDQGEARHLMRCAIRANPKDLLALRQEVYLDLNAKDEQAASEDIDSLRRQGASSPQFEAQQGYIYANQRRFEEARIDFNRVAADPDADPAMREQALAGLRVIDAAFPRHLLTLSTDAQYLNRFDDGIVDATARYMERLGTRSPVMLYLNARLLRDTASQGGTLPQIFSDNAFLTGVGAQFQPAGAHFALTAEANEAYVFYGSRNGSGALVPDFRTVAGYYKTWRSVEDIYTAERFSFEANGSVGFYSRYGHDGIAYVQPREIFDLLRKGSVRLAPFFQQSVALDTNRLFYNNIAELIPGLEVSSLKLHGIALRAEYVRGYYLPIATGEANPYGGSYNDFRIRLIFQKSIPLGLGEGRR